jgi:glycerophosphoryl diester phosphodiesterase
MCGVDRDISLMPYAEIKNATLANTTQPIPTFQEVLETVRGRVPLIVEIKTGPHTRIAELTKRVHEMLSAYQGNYCVESFDPRCLRWYRKNAPHVIRGQLSAKGLGGITYLITNFLCRPDFIAYDCTGDRNLSVWLMRHLFHALMVAWTVRDREAYCANANRFRLQIFEGMETPASK